jgi:predicted nucleic acid-binding protein
MTLVVDASVAAKWLVPEPESGRAEDLRLTGEALVAPALVIAEIGNAVWKRAVRGIMTPAEATDAVLTGIGLFNALVPLEELAARATELAIDLRHPIYDCFYLALAEREHAPVVSADAKLLAAAKRVKGIETRVL